MAKRIAPALFALALSVGAAGGALAQGQPAAPSGPGQAAVETPQQNVRASQQYQQLVCGNPKFRATRIEKECGPLQGSSFYDSCVASFNCEKQPSDANWNKPPPSETIR